MTEVFCTKEQSFTFMELSCPECGEMICMRMNLDIESSLFKNLGHAVREMMGIAEYYYFRGIQQCSCGKMVVSSLTVSAHGI